MTVDRNKLITIAGLANFKTRLIDEIEEGLDSNLSKAEDYEVDNYIFGIQPEASDSCPSQDSDNGSHEWESNGSGQWECQLCGAITSTDPNN